MPTIKGTIEDFRRAFPGFLGNVAEVLFKAESGDAPPKRSSAVIPMKLPSLSNVRMHWRTLDRLKRKQKQLVALYLSIGILPPLPVVVTLTRRGPRALDDDNLASAFKCVRDEIARAYEVDDGSTLYQWRYEQEKGKYAITIEIDVAQ